MLHNAECCKWAWPDDVTLQFKVDWRYKFKNSVNKCLIWMN